MMTAALHEEDAHGVWIRHCTNATCICIGLFKHLKESASACDTHKSAGC